jgi:hypothetical protein
MPRATNRSTEGSGAKDTVLGCLLFLAIILPIGLTGSFLKAWIKYGPDWVTWAFMGVLGLLVVAGVLPRLLSRIDIGPEGLTVRLVRLFEPRVKVVAPWGAIDTVILDQPRHGRRSQSRGHPPQPARLLVVPAAGVDLGLPATHRSPLDGRACILLLSFNQVRDSPDEVAQALAQYGGSRFVDARPQRHQHDAPKAGMPKAGVPRFDLGLRGYDRARVDELIEQAHAALRSANAAERLAARSALDAVSLPRAARGYDCSQVDAYLTALSVELASPPASRFHRGG